MELTPAHLRYLLAIYEVSQTHLDISSRSIAEKLGVTKPSVVRVMNLLMERGMIVKEYYGKIYLTDRGIFVAREVEKAAGRGACPLPAGGSRADRRGAADRCPRPDRGPAGTGLYRTVRPADGLGGNAPGCGLTACQDSKKSQTRPESGSFWVQDVRRGSPRSGGDPRSLRCPQGRGRLRGTPPAGRCRAPAWGRQGPACRRAAAGRGWCGRGR